MTLVCLPAAVALGFLVRPVTSMTYLPFYVGADIQSLLDIVWLFAPRFVLTAVFPLVLLFAVLLLTFCGMLSVIEKHFRIGRILLKKSLSEINSYFLPGLKILLILGGMLLIYFALLMSLTGLQHYIVSGVGVPSVASVIIASVLSLGLFAVLSWLCSPLMFMVPLMQIYGYSFGDALTSSVSYYGNQPFKITFGFFSVFLIVSAVGIVIASLSLYIPPIFQTLVWIVLHLFLLVYIGAYSMVTTFSITGMERKDNKKYYD